MIAQLQQSLIQRNSTYEKKKNVEVTEAKEISLKDRLALLNNSSEQWKTRQAPPTTAVLQRRISSNVLQDLPIFQRAQQLSRHSMPVQEKPCDITSGLKKFFKPSTKAEPTVTQSQTETKSNDEIDLDLISSKATPTLKSISRPRAPNRKRAGKNEIIDERTRLESVKIDEEAFQVVEEEPEKLETQEQAIAAIKGAKQLLKSPTKVSPFPEVMLIQIRGSKHVDVRLVSPSITSLNESACFIVVHQKNLLKYEGINSNILEKTKTAQICIEILGKSDLNCHADAVITVTDKKAFSKFLGSSENFDEILPQNAEIGPYENTISKLNLVFRITDQNSAETCSRRERLSYSILDPNDVMIFDFGSEIYVWSGRNTSKVQTAYGVEYGKQLMRKGIKTTLLGEMDQMNLDEKRPEWTLFRRIHQGVLDTLFKSKFSDWPEKNEVITSCRPRSLITTKKNPGARTYEEIKVSNQDDDVDFLAQRMLQEEDSDPILMLEDQEIDRKMKDIISESLDLWILKGEFVENIDFSNHFDSNKCYVLRWKYRIQKSGIRRIRTGKEEERETGRSRIAFFYWLGEQTTPKMHGLCALRIKEIDKDNSPRIRVADGNEPALFLALFDGKFMVSSDIHVEKQRRYVVIGANSQETSLREIEDLESKYRSHAAYIETGPGVKKSPQIICGANCTQSQVHFVLSHSENLQSGSSVNVEVEGDKKSREWINSTGRKRSMRVWRIFENESEQLNHLSGHEDCSFTFSQQILTETILIDVGEALWLWSEEVVSTFSLKLVEKYWNSRIGPAKVVYKGAEPIQFKALFMKWTDFEIEENGDSLDKKTRDAKELLKERCRTFSLEELKERSNLPAGMDMRRLESYLTDEDFSSVFGMKRSEFYEQKAWKQNEARKKAGLF